MACKKDCDVKKCYNCSHIKERVLNEDFETKQQRVLNETLKKALRKDEKK